MGIAPQSDAEANVREKSRQQEAGLDGSYEADDVDAVQARLEKAHQ